ncbi:MAG: hypothetical protein JJU42_07685 [Rhodobacteraceae bacterium]|nr:hypothetical protein [Paracoccaceae bacterium]
MIRPALFAAPLAALILSLPPAPLAAQAPCLPLGGEVALCGGGTVWADARALPVADDADYIAYEAPPLYLEASLDWIMPADAGTIEAALALLEAGLAEEAAADGDPAPVRWLRDTVVTDHVTVALDIFAEVFEGTEYPLAVLLVADGGDWLTLFLSGDTPMAPAAFEAEARALAGLLRPAPEG